MPQFFKPTDKENSKNKSAKETESSTASLSYLAPATPETADPKPAELFYAGFSR